MEYYKKIKKNRIDICNICEQKKELTWEHVPPKSCGNNNNVAISNFFNLQNYKEKIDSQNGIKYRTICRDCNNTILGARADIELEKLYRSVINFVVNRKNADKITCIEINLILLLKSLFGKVLAMDNSLYKDDISVAMREFILEGRINSNLHVYFRLYPFKTTIQARAHVVNGGYAGYHTKGLISVLYFYPLAFIVSSLKEELILVDLMDYVNFDKPMVKMHYGPLSAYNPLTNELLPHDWLVGVGDNKHDILLTNEDNLAIVSVKR